MKGRLILIAAVLFLGLGFSCEDSLEEVTNDSLIEVESTNPDEDMERERPGQN